MQRFLPWVICFCFQVAKSCPEIQDTAYQLGMWDLMLLDCKCPRNNLSWGRFPMQKWLEYANLKRLDEFWRHFIPQNWSKLIVGLQNLFPVLDQKVRDGFSIRIPVKCDISMQRRYRLLELSHISEVFVKHKVEDIRPWKPTSCILKKLDDQQVSWDAGGWDQAFLSILKFWRVGWSLWWAVEDNSKVDLILGTFLRRPMISRFYWLLLIR
jgi:hypothetical protein